MMDNTVFDKYGDITDRRKEFLQHTLADLIPRYGLRTAMDVGCGVGYFSNFLARMGLNVAAFDGRDENVIEARNRYPDIAFERYDIEDARLSELEPRDFVLCFGLLYHLENPFRAIRNLSSLTKKFLIIESMIAPYLSPSAVLIDEAKSIDQALSYIALVPSEACLVKMLYGAGFPHVYRAAKLPNHEDFKATLGHKRRRTILVASKSRLSPPMFRELREASVSNVWERKIFRILNKIKTLRSRLAGR